MNASHPTGAGDLDTDQVVEHSDDRPSETHAQTPSQASGTPPAPPQPLSETLPETPAEQTPEQANQPTAAPVVDVASDPGAAPASMSGVSAEPQAQTEPEPPASEIASQADPVVAPEVSAAAEAEASLETHPVVDSVPAMPEPEPESKPEPGTQTAPVAEKAAAEADPATETQGDAPAEAPADASPEGPAFRDLGLPPALLAALERVGYETPSPIQAKTIPHLLAGHDLLGHAPTGTGKTAAFVLPMLANLDLDDRVPQALVLTPTRELAIQVAEACQRYAQEMRGFQVLPIYGGSDYRGQLRQLERGVHVVVGTPGRVMDHLRRGTLVLDDLRMMVLDEADEMLRMGFIDDVEWVLEQVPADRQLALFSATLPRAIERIAQSHLQNPVEVSIEARTATAETISQRWWLVSGLHKLDALTRILEVEPFDAMLIFVRTKTATVELAERLEARGYAAAALNGDLPQKLREQIVERLKRGQLDVIVATDVAARGLDVERISHVINYDIPYDTEAYIHRIGRTGRAGRTGEAILFVAPRERRMLRAIERATRQPIEPLQLPSTETVNDARVAGFKQRITDALAAGELDFLQSLVEQYQQEHDIPAVEIAAALARLVIGEQPLLLPPEQERPPRRDNRDRDRSRDQDRERPRADRPRREQRDRDDRRPRDRDDWRARDRGDRSQRPTQQRGWDNDRPRPRDDDRAPKREQRWSRDRDERSGPVERDLPPARSARDDGAQVPVRSRSQDRDERPRRDDDRRPSRDYGRDQGRDQGRDRRFDRDDRRPEQRDRFRDAPRDRFGDRDRDDDRGPRERRGPPEEGMERYRIEVGHEDGVKPGNIVGAIANEAGLEGRYIGRIDIRDDHTTLDLPSGMPKEIFQHLKKTRVCGRQLAIRRLGGKPPRDD